MQFKSMPKMLVRVLLGLTVLIGAAALVSAPKSSLTKKDKAYYADPNLVNFVRPGLVVKVLSADIATDGTVKARVKFTDLKGLGLDKDGIQTPGLISNGNPSAIVAYIPKGQTQYVSYTTRTQTSATYGQKRGSSRRRFGWYLGKGR